MAPLRGRHIRADTQEWKHQWNAEDKEYDKWLQRMKTNPPWKSKDPTPAEKVQSVTHPIGEETGTEIVEQMLKKSGKSWAKAIGHGLKKTGLVFNILANPKDAW
ncbi:MAG: hypothetical protein JEY79_01895 [Pseudodesulfovibrio sp.]|nr:hypothetical protein [Pseudodesulfovibrio sp.]